ncbi:hypothetical protein D3C75_1037650 [compost metagenome]
MASFAECFNPCWSDCYTILVVLDLSGYADNHFTASLDVMRVQAYGVLGCEKKGPLMSLSFQQSGLFYHMRKVSLRINLRFERLLADDEFQHNSRFYRVMRFIQRNFTCSQLQVFGCR